MVKKVRTRFAPSPTGNLHVGGARTALFNWLFARNQGGDFVLRIEDTDASRSTSESTDSILNDMKWLGLYWDEGPETGGPYGPYFQAQRKEIHEDAVSELIKRGAAYRCFCDPKALAAEREKARLEKRAYRYEGICRSINESDSERLISQGRPFAVRIKVPDGESTFNDMIRGEISFANKDIEDFVIMRGDGTAVYNLAAVADDHDMKISHVIRGDDHISNTPKQLLIYDAFGWERPVFAHLPMIVGSDGKPLSKRHGTVTTENFIKSGYLPETMINFLALLGWSLDESTTIISVDKLIKEFSVDRIAMKSAVWDVEKLMWMNGTYIRELDDESIHKRTLPFFKKRYKEFSDDDNELLKKSLPLVKERIKTLSEAVELLGFLYEEVSLSKEALELLENESAKSVLSKALNELDSLKEEDFNAMNIESVLRDVCEDLKLKPRKGFQPVRVALTGSKISPPLFESMELLGRERCIDRLRVAMKSIREC